jgi:O-antigen/teichoic acid export membrane protein
MSADAPSASARAHPETVMTAAGRSVSSATMLYTIAMGAVLPVGIVSAIVATHYLTPTQFGQLGLLMVLASFLTVIYNIGLLHGTFLWVYGSSGDADMDVEVEGLRRATMPAQRRAMSTGLILTLIVAGAGTVLCFMFAAPLAALLLGSASYAKLVGLAAISGGSGSIFRMTINVFRLERRPLTFTVMSVIRPLAVLAVSTALIVSGEGVYGAVLGTALPTLGCALICMLLGRRSYALAFSMSDARAIGARSANVVIPVVALWIGHNGDIYLLSHWVHGADLGVYRLASRLGTPPSYFASAFLMAFSPMERTALFHAAFKAHGQLRVRSLALGYYIVAGLAIVVFFTLFSHLFLLVAPPSYADAAKVVPLVALAFVAYGAYIITLRTVRPEPFLRWYASTAALSAAVFVLTSAVLIPKFGMYGAPAAMAIGMISGTVAILVANSLKRFNRRPLEERLPVPARRLGATIGVSAVAAAVGLMGAASGRAQAATLIVAVIILYPLALVASGAVPRSHVPVLWAIVRGRRSGTTLPIEELPLPERETVVRFQRGELRGGTTAIEYARFVRALRRLGGIGVPTFDDARIGAYVASNQPESVRDYQLKELLQADIDGHELHRLDRLAHAVRRGRAKPSRRRPDSRAAIRVRVKALGLGELRELAGAIRTAQRQSRASTALPLVHPVRELRPLAGLGRASGRDLVLARALWSEEADEPLAAAERRELRALKIASQSVLRRADGGKRRQTPGSRRQIFSNIAIPPKRPRNAMPSSAVVSSTARRTP